MGMAATRDAVPASTSARRATPLRRAPAAAIAANRTPLAASTGLSSGAPTDKGRRNRFGAGIRIQTVTKSSRLDANRMAHDT